MNPKTQKRLEALLATFDGGAVQPEELIQAIEAVMAIIDQNGRTLVDKIVETKAASDAEIAKLKSELSQTHSNIQTVITQVREKSTTSVADVRKALLNEIKSEIKRVESLIPVLPPETDLSEVFIEIENQKIQLKELSFLITGENIRNALETLEGDERLDVSAIKGISKREKKMSDSLIERAISIVDNRTSFLINKVSNLQAQVDSNPGGGYTDLTQFVAQTPHRVFYSNASGDVTELALGADGTFLKSNGATSAPTFETPPTGSVTVETPSGAVNSSNTGFTVTAIPMWIVSDGTTYFENLGYTRSSLSITMEVPPSQYIRAIS